MSKFMRAIGWLAAGIRVRYHLAISLCSSRWARRTAFERQNLKLDMLPWHGSELNYWLIGLGVAGLLSLILAAAGKLRFLFPIWRFTFLYRLVRGLFLSPSYTFSGPDQFNSALWLAGGALLAFLGSLTVFGRNKKA